MNFPSISTFAIRVAIGSGTDGGGKIIGININWTPWSAPTLSAPSCPSSLTVNQSGTCTASASASLGTVGYNWSVSMGSVSPSGSSATISSGSAGTMTVTVTAYITQAPSYSTTQSTTVSIIAPSISVSLSCPTSLNPGQNGTCTASATTTPSGSSVNYSWSVSGGTYSGSGSSVTVSSTTAPGTMTVTVTGTLASYPSYTDTKSVSVTINAPTVSATISCPSSLDPTSSGTCTVTASTNTTSSMTYSWSATGGTLSPTSGSSVTFTATTAGNATVTVTATLSSYPSYTDTKSATIVVSSPTITVTLTCPSGLWPNESGTCTVSATSNTNSSVNYTWSASSTGSVSGSGTSVTVTAGSTPGTLTVTVTGSLASYPSTTDTKSASITIKTPTVTASISCPATMNPTDSGTCMASATSNTTSGISYAWTATGGTVSPTTGQSVTFMAVSGGNATVTVTATLTSYPGYSSTASATIVVSSPTITVTLSCPSSLNPTTSGTCTATSSSNTSSSVTYTWSASGGTVSGSGASVTVTAGSTPGSMTVTVTGKLDSYPSTTDTKSATITIPAPTITLSISCPSYIYYVNSGTCTATGSTSFGSLTYSWSATGGTVSGSGTSATIASSNPGTTMTVTVTATSVESPSVSSSQSASVEVRDVQITLTVSCPTNLWQTEQGTCTATGSAPTGTVEYTGWTVDLGTVTATGSQATVLSGAAGTMTVTASARLQEDPTNTKSASATITIEAITVTASVACPASLVRDDQGTCTTTASASYGGVSYAWNTDLGTITPSGATATISSYNTGTMTVTVTVSSVQVPTTTTTTSTTVQIQPVPITLSLSCPTQLWEGQSDVCTATASSSKGTLTYAWTATGGTVSGAGASVSVSSMTLGTMTVTVQVGLVEYPDQSTSASQNIQIVPVPISLSISCPASLYLTQPGDCVATASAPYGTLVYTWSVTGGASLTPNGGYVTVSNSVTGPITVTIDVTLQEYPGSENSKSATIQIQTIPISLSLTCPDSLYMIETGNCQAVASPAYGSPIYTWSGTNGSITGSADVATISSSLPGTMTVTVAVTLSGITQAPVTTSVPVTILAVNLQATVTCPTALYVTEPGQCTATATSEYGTVVFTWSALGGQITPTGATADVVSDTPGTMTVTVVASLVESPTWTNTVSTSITINDVTISLSLSCPSTVQNNTDSSCSVTGTSTYGTVEVTDWSVSPDGSLTVSGSGTGGTGGAAALNTFRSMTGGGTSALTGSALGSSQVGVKFATPGTKAVQVQARLSGTTLPKQSARVGVQVIGWVAPRLVVLGPLSVLRKDTATYNAFAETPQGTVEITWGASDVTGTTTGQSYSFTRDTLGAVTLTVTARIVEANGAPDAQTVVQRTIQVRPQMKPVVTLDVPRMVRQGETVTLTATGVLRSAPDLPVAISWTQPDLTVVDGSSIPFMSAVAGRYRFVVTATAQGYDLPEEQGSRIVILDVRPYSFPTNLSMTAFGDLYKTVPYTFNFRINGDFSKSPGGVFAYAWDFGDGNTLSTSSTQVSNTYMAIGTYPVTVVITDQFGTAQTVSATVEITQAPAASFVLRTQYSNRWGKAPAIVTIWPRLQNLPPRDRVVLWEWMYAGQVVSNNDIGRLAFDVPGSYPVSVRATTQLGVVVTQDLVIDVVPDLPPECTLTLTPIVGKLAARGQAVCKDPDGRIKEIDWDLGNGQTLLGRTVVVGVYPNAGTYTMTVHATDDGGNETVAFDTVVVSP